MSRVCELTGVGPKTGNNVSHSNRKTRTRWFPNLQKKRFFVPELNEFVSMKVTTRAVRTIDKQGGVVAAIKKAKEENLSEALLSLKNRLRKMGV